MDNTPANFNDSEIDPKDLFSLAKAISKDHIKMLTDNPVIPMLKKGRDEREIDEASKGDYIVFKDIASHY